jgi:iron complex outermembrane recepter protein
MEVRPVPSHASRFSNDVLRFLLVALPALLIPVAVPATSSASADLPDPFASPLGDTATLRGRVVDATSGGAPVPGALVSLVELARTVRTDATGRFHIMDVPRGGWTLRAESEGLRPATMGVDVPGEPTAPVDVTLSFTERLFRLEEVVASVSPLRNPVGYQPAHGLDREELTRRLGSSVGTMLDGEPGVAMRSLGPAPARPVIRGFDGDRVLVLENGERMGDLAETAADHALSLDPLTIRRVEVVRGPASLLYGSSALGGVVNLITGDLPRSWARGFSGSVGTHGATVNRSAAVSGDMRHGADRWVGTGRFSLREAGDLRTPEARLPGTHLSSMDGQVGFQRESGAWRAGFSFSFLDRRYGVPEAIEDPDQEIVISTERQALQARLDWEPAGLGRVEGLEVRVHATRFFQEELERRFGNTGAALASGAGRRGAGRSLLQEDVELSFLQHGATATATLRHGALGPVEAGVMGAAFRLRDLDVGGEEAFTPGAREGSMGLFTFQEFALTTTTRFQFGLRAEGQRSRTLPNADFPDAEDRRTSLALSGSVGLNWRPASGWEVGAQLARAHRNPTVEELFASGPHLGAGAYEIGDPGLTDEVGHGVDLFIRRGSDRLALELAGFLSHISGFVAFQPTGQEDPASGLPVFRYEATRGRMAGGEATVSTQLTPAWKVAAGVDYVRGDRVERGAPSVPLPTIPPLRGRLDLRYESGRHWVGVTSRAVAAQRRVAPDEEATGGYLLLDGDAGLRIDAEGRHTVVLRVENATNRLYRDHLSRVEERGFPMPARNLSLIYRLRF